AAGPQQAALPRRLGDGENRAIDLDASVVAGDGAAGPFLLAPVVAREIIADLRPGLAFVLRHEENVGPVIDLVQVVRRDDDGGGCLRPGGWDVGRIGRRGGYHARPPSVEMSTPPSLLSMMRLGSFGSIQTS